MKPCLIPGDEDGVLIVDGSDFPKQGTESVGVKRQWCGQLGRVANCQAGVFLGYASQHGYTLLDRRLYIPGVWFEDEVYADRRHQCGVPEHLAFQTKQELAEVPANTQVWVQRPYTEVPAWSGYGRKPTRVRLAEGEPESQAVTLVAAQLPQEAWQQYTIKEGTKGPIVAEFAALRVINARKNLPGHEVWLICRRDITSHEHKFYLSNALPEIPLATFVRVAGLRWPIESCFEEGKLELGLDDYQVRSWVGWHHHMTLCILAHFFLVRIQRRLQDKAPKLTLAQAILLLKAVLPQPQFDLETTVEIVNYYQRRHKAAYLSHRKRRMRSLEK